MPSYENKKCPVCDKIFADSDDIVTCPHCGTPHHRECYNSLGQCVNKDKHGTGFAYQAYDEKPKQEDTDNKKTEKSNYFHQPSAENDGKAKCTKCGEEIEKDAVFCNKCGARQPSPEFQPHKPIVNFSFAPKEETAYRDSKDEIDGVSLSDVGDAVRTNREKFIPKFLSGKKCSWNWSAFFFGPFYLLFRKMYKEGAIFLAIRLIIALVTQGIYAKEFAEFSKFAMANMEKFTANPTEELINQFYGLYEAILPMLAIILIGNVIIHISIALFADRMYRSKAISIVKNVNKKLDEGGMFGQTMMMENDSQPRLSQEDMKRLYLGKMGGTSIFAPFMAYFVLDLITTIISKL